MAELSACLTCEKTAAKINFLLAKSEDTWSWSWESKLVVKFQEFKANTTCSTCQSITRHLPSDDPPCRLQHSKLLIYISSNPLRIRLEPKCTIETIEENDGDEKAKECPHFHDVFDFILSHEQSPLNEHFLLLDHDWIDIERIKRWPKFCDENHASVCHSSPNRRLANFMVFIDVNDYCLVQKDQPEKYVALSYVWGKIPDILTTRRSNYDELQQKGSLMDSQNFNRIPKTIQEAILFTKMIDHSYLWVDSLCIVQDDSEFMKKQLSQMASIYADSSFTIIATDGTDANHGLQGIGVGSSTRSYVPKLFRFSSNCVMMSATDVEDHGGDTNSQKEWHKRGWTFQERILPRRKIIFSGGTLSWECRCAVWYEKLAGEADGVVGKPWDGIHNIYNYLPQAWPDIHSYARLAAAYNKRLLTYESDSLNAFSGILDSLSPSFDGGFIYGLPESFFDFTLLWMPSTPIRRRGDVEAALPSWSWVGWQGNIVFSCLYITQSDPVRYPTTSLVITKPMSRYYKTEKHTGSKQLITNNYSIHEAYRDDPSRALPSGWSREIVRNKGIDRPYFTHKQFPNLEFEHPLPINASQSNTPQRIEWATELCFHTQRAHVFVGTVLKSHHTGKSWCNIEKKLVSFCLQCTLVESNSRFLGMLHLNTSREEDVVVGEKCEIVVLSSGTARLGTKLKGTFYGKRILEEWEFVEEIRELEVYEFYNVLRVERRDGRTYRSAVGRVWKDGWQRLGLAVDEVDVVLS